MEGKKWKKKNLQIYEIHNNVITTSSVARRDRLVVTTLRCGRSNPGSNPGHGIFFITVCFLFVRVHSLPAERCYATYDLHATLDLFVCTDTPL